MIIFEVVGKVRNSMVGYPRASNNREPLLLLRPRSRELLLEHSCREANGEGCPRGSFSIPREILSICNYLTWKISQNKYPNVTVLPLAESRSAREPLMPECTPVTRLSTRLSTHHQVKHPGYSDSRSE